MQELEVPVSSRSSCESHRMVEYWDYPLLFRRWYRVSQRVRQYLDSGLLLVLASDVQILIWVSGMVVKHAADSNPQPIFGSEFAQSELVRANGVSRPIAANRVGFPSQSRVF